MNGYQRRAPFYRSEFAVRDDFPLLGGCSRARRAW